jgi:transposase
VTSAVLEWLRRRIREQPDITLQELQQQLEQAQALRLSMGRLWLALRQAGLKLEKVTPRRRAGHSRSASAPAGMVGRGKALWPGATGVPR